MNTPMKSRRSTNYRRVRRVKRIGLCAHVSFSFRRDREEKHPRIVQEIFQGGKFLSIPIRQLNETLSFQVKNFSTLHKIRINQRHDPQPRTKLTHQYPQFEMRGGVRGRTLCSRRNEWFHGPPSMEPKLIPPAPMMTTLKFSPGAGGGCLSMANSMSSVERRRTGFFPGGMVLVDLLRD